jgi:molybdate transport repressor ModE-like protein
LVSGVVDLVTFELLEQIAESGSVTAAAGVVGISQQAASSRIDRLERRLGRRLLVRGASGSMLTDEGGMVLEWAVPVLAAARRAEFALDALRNPDPTVTVVASQTVAEFLLPAWLQTLRSDRPDVAVRLVSGNSADVAAQVRAGIASVGFLESPETPADLGNAPVGSDVLVVVVAPGHPWAGWESVGAEQLAAAPLLLRELGSGTRATLERWLAREGLTMSRPAAVLNTTSAIRAAAVSGIAPAVLSRRAVVDDLRAGRLVAVPAAGPAMRRMFTAVWTGALPQPHAAFLIEIARRRRSDEI